MNTTTIPLPSLLRFSVGASRIGVRHETTWVRQRVTSGRYRPKKMDQAGFWEGHGEEIWVFSHLTTKQVVYSTKPALDSNRALKQLPFNGKKTKPAKLRRDYWQPMAKIRFPKGEGEVGRSVFQALREFKRRHELEWGYQTEDLYKMNRLDRGKALNNQKANAVADICAVMGGAGKGNLMHHTMVQVQPGKDRASSSKDGPEPPTKQNVVNATIFWANQYDPGLAKTWPENVSHRLGNLSMTREEEAALAAEETLPEDAASVNAKS